MKYLQWLAVGILWIAMKSFVSSKRFDSTKILFLVGLLVVCLIVWYCYDSVIASRQGNSASKNTDSPQVPQKDVPVVSHENVVSGINSEYAKALKHYLSENAAEYIHAKSIFRQLAEGNDAKAMFIVGLFEEEGIGGFKVDTQQASEWYERARAQGDALATYMCLRNDESLDETSKREIVNQVLAVASQGDVFAQTIMGRMCAQGWGMEQNYAVAREWYANAIRQGDPLATYYDSVCEEKMDDFRFGGTSVVAFAHFKKAADIFRLPKAQYQVGRISEQRNAVRDAADYYSRAAAAGVEEAQIALGRITDFWAVKATNNPLFIQNWNIAAAHGEPNAQKSLGFCYYEGWQTPKDYTQAVKWWKLAADNGCNDVLLQFYLGVCYWNGYGVEKDEVEAARWFYKAAMQNMPEAQHNLGIYYEQNMSDNEKAVEWYEKSANQGHAPAQLAMGLCCFFGRGVEKDKQKGIDWFIKAGNQGIAAAQYILGEIYSKGDGVEQDATKAEQWLSQAVGQGYAKAQYYIGMLYLNGEHGFIKDTTKAISFLMLAAKQGHLGAQTRLGVLYIVGIGVSPDYKQGLEWLERPLSQGYADAQYEMGRCCFEGVGVEKDISKAKHLWTLAAEQGHNMAKFMLSLSEATDKIDNIIEKIRAAEKKTKLKKLYEKSSLIVNSFQPDNNPEDSDILNVVESNVDDDYFQFLEGIDYKEASETSSAVEEPSSDNPDSPISNDAGTKEKTPKEDADSVPMDDLLKSLDGFTDFLEENADKNAGNR